MHTCKSKGLHVNPFQGQLSMSISMQARRPMTLTDPVPSFCDFGDTNFQYPEVPWYPDPPVFDF